MYDELADHGIVVHRNLGPLTHTRVHADVDTTRLEVVLQNAGAGGEIPAIGDGNM